MPCNIPVEKGVRSPAECKCYNAVMRAYEGMIDSGAARHIALDAAVHVYSYHHPEDAKEDRMLTVDRWVNEGRLH